MAKILLVEDDNNLREIYGARLGAEGHDIVSAQDGEEALAIAVKEKPDLIIADVMMPRVSGFDMLDILRNAPETKNTKVIMMTALSQPEDKEHADRLGADRYLVKSQVTLEDVAQVVREILGGSTAEPVKPTVDENPELPQPTQLPVAPPPEPVSQPPAPQQPSENNVETPVADPESVSVAEAPTPVEVSTEPVATAEPTFTAPEPEISSTPPAPEEPASIPRPQDPTQTTTIPVAEAPKDDTSQNEQANTSPEPAPVLSAPTMGQPYSVDDSTAGQTDTPEPPASPIEVKKDNPLLSVLEPAASAPDITKDLEEATKALGGETIQPEGLSGEVNETPPASVSIPVASPPEQPEEKVADSPQSNTESDQSVVGPNLAQALAEEEKTVEKQIADFENNVEPTVIKPTVVGPDQPGEDNKQTKEEAESQNPATSGSEEFQARKKKVIQPINDLTKKPDLEALARAEEEKINIQVSIPSSENMPNLAGNTPVAAAEEKTAPKIDAPDISI